MSSKPNTNFLDSNEIIYNISQEFPSIDKLEDLIFDPISIEHGLKQVQIVRDYLADYDKISNENQMLKDRIKLLEENTVTSYADLMTFQKLQSELESAKTNLINSQIELKALQITLDNKSDDEQRLMEALQTICEKFLNIDCTIEHQELNYRDNISKISNQMNLLTQQFESTQSELIHLKEVNKNLLEQLDTNSLQIVKMNFTIDQTKADLIEANVQLAEKVDRENLLVTEMLHFSDILDNIHLLVDRNEIDYRQKLQQLESQLVTRTEQMQLMEIKLLASYDELKIMDEIREELRLKEDHINEYVEKIRTMKDSSATDSLVPPSPSGGDDVISQLQRELRAKDEFNDKLKIRLKSLEMLSIHYEELKMRYRDKRFLIAKLQMEKDQIQCELNSLKQLYQSKSWNS